ncbi:MFS transporter [Actinospica sp.]|jgi:MFS family permease|uniref:MFS transporter n=1 Tax=Actinospica sp. TaxID=1872142 RepID=UPI002CD598A1|nr:MFS transporter [Actinospica sp.]HWG25983.1 MFS transporter [Actinospica sp.]
MVLGRRSLGREFRWLWSAYAVSTFGTGLAFGAFPLMVIIVLHGGSTEVATLSAAGRAVGAVFAIPLAPWVEFRRKRPVMITMDVTRFAALLTVPLAYAFGRLTFAQLLVVSVVVGAADIAFKAASGACLKSLVRPGDLLTANGRFESTNWSSIVLGPPLGGLLIGVFGPVTTVVADAVSFLLSACGIRAIGGAEPRPEHADRLAGLKAGELFEGWRYIFGDRSLRLLLLNAAVVNGLIMATEPLLAVMMLGRLGFPAWEYGLAFAVPCIGGLIGSRVARPIATRFGQRKILLVTGALRACWVIGLVAMRPGVAGLVIIMAVELGLIISCGLFNPVLATYRLEQSPPDRVARVLGAWSVTTSGTIAVMTALGGVLAEFTGPLTAIGIAGSCLLATPFLLPWHRGVVRAEDLVGQTRHADRVLVMRRRAGHELVREQAGKDAREHALAAERQGPDLLVEDVVAGADEQPA